MFGGLTQKRTKSKRVAATHSAGKAPKLHSIGGLLKGREIAGAFEVGGSSYSFTYSPATAAVVGKRLQLSGNLAISAAGPATQPKPVTRRAVKATLVGIQGGIGSAPPRGKLPPEVYTLHPGQPSVDSTGSLSFAGVLYLHLEPLIGSAFGLNADLSRLQLNARLWPVEDLERKIQAAFSAASDALLGKNIDLSLAEESVSELNKLFSA